jgi:single-stranded DNA-binding protein
MQKIIITGKLKEDVTTKEVDESFITNFNVIASKNSGYIDEPRTHYSCILETPLTNKEGNAFFQYLKKGTNIIVEGYPEAIIIKDETEQPQAHIQIRVTYCELVGTN